MRWMSRNDLVFGLTRPYWPIITGHPVALWTNENMSSREYACLCMAGTVLGQETPMKGLDQREQLQLNTRSCYRQAECKQTFLYGPISNSKPHVLTSFSSHMAEVGSRS